MKLKFVELTTAKQKQKKPLETFTQETHAFFHNVQLLVQFESEDLI